MPGQRAGHLGRAPTHPRRALPRGRAAHGAFVTAASTEPPRSRAPLAIPLSPAATPGGAQTPTAQLRLAGIRGLTHRCTAGRLRTRRDSRRCV